MYIFFIYYYFKNFKTYLLLIKMSLEELLSLKKELGSKFVVVAAVGEDNVIGIKSEEGYKLPWYLPEDLNHFRETTLNSVVLMGRNTYDSLPEKNKPLPKRLNLVLSRSKERNLYGDHIYVPSVEEVLKLLIEYKNLDEESLRKKGIGFDLGFNNVYIIGGSKVYNMFLNPDSDDFAFFADELLITRVRYKPELKEGDEFVYFPDFKDFEEHYGLPIVKPALNRVYFSQNSRPEGLQYQLLTYYKK